jgi:hypothetical protein
MMLFPCFDCGGQISLSEQQIQEIITKVGEKLPALSYILTCKCKRSEWALEVRVVRKPRGGEDKAHK